MKIKKNVLLKDELVDIVDEQDTVLFQMLKKEAHKKGLLHRCIVAEVFDSSGRFVLVRPASDKQDAGQYVSAVGGHIQSGEPETVALQREVLEEIGLQHFDFRYKGKAIFERDILGRHENHYLLLYEIHSDERFVLSRESIEYQSFSVEELKQKLHYQPELFGDAFFFIVELFYPYLLEF